MSDDASSTTPETSMITDPASIKNHNRGPITKYFEPPSSCAATMSFDGNMYYGWGYAGIVDTACYPMGTVSSKQISPPSAWDLFYYSPAVCPGGWGSVTTFTSGVPNGNHQTSISLGSDTTAVLCCPSGYVYVDDSGHICTSTFTKDQSIVYVSPTLDLEGNIQIGSTTPSVYPSSSHAFANGIVIMHQSSDGSILNSATRNPNPTTTASTTATPSDRSSASTPSNTSSSTDTAGTSSGGLSTGAKIGIGVSIPLAALLGLAFGFFLFRRRRAARGAAPPPDYEKVGMAKHVDAEPIQEAYIVPAEIGGNDNARGPSAGEQEHQRHELQ